MNVELSSSLWTLRQKQKLRSQKVVLGGYAILSRVIIVEILIRFEAH